MKALGLVVEYNPFHNGHLYHLNQSLKESHADVVIAVMSGHFTQRGEPTVVDKWTRTKMALEYGVDLVVELPYVYSCQHANLFAKGAVTILTHLQASALIFGSESGNISELIQLERLTSSEAFKEKLQKQLKTGLSLPKAHTRTLIDFNVSLETASAPNNTLGLHYIRAANEINSPISLQTIPRIHSAYHDILPTHHQIGSATSIRLLRENLTSYASYVPEGVHKTLSQYHIFHTWEHYYPILKQKILTLTPTLLVDIHDMKEGLEYRFFAAATHSTNFAEFMNFVQTKRYTKTRIKRICANILTHTTKRQIEELDLENSATYIRILGLSTNGKRYLKMVKKEISVPIYSKFATALWHEQKVTAAYSAILPEPYCRDLNIAEFSNFPILK